MLIVDNRTQNSNVCAQGWQIAEGDGRVILPFKFGRRLWVKFGCRLTNNSAHLKWLEKISLVLFPQHSLLKKIIANE